MTSAWQDHISPGDIVTFRFPIRKATDGEQPKPRPCLVIEVEEWAGKQFALLAYGTSSPRKANSGYEVHALQPEDYTRFGLDRPTRFIGKRTIMVALDNPSFDSFRKTCSPVLGRLSGQPAERLLHVRARIQADRDMARATMLRLLLVPTGAPYPFSRKPFPMIKLFLRLRATLLSNPNLTHRGQVGAIKDGKSAGGLSFGYVIPVDPLTGLRKVGELVIDEDQALIIRRIFQAFADGTSPRAIAHQLNEEGVPAPRGGGWKVNTIYGNAGKGTGILNNELYIGQRVWNRLRYKKNPETDRRNARHRASEILGELIEGITIRHDAALGATLEIEGKLLEMLKKQSPPKRRAMYRTLVR
ncbi:recombinase family protein [Thioclava sp. GXIMD4216]|uniref:recombinase family protein n=1 Tax=Thioclava sp. GXIMD4216 TaxID=3131929 RepID=UPI0030D1FD45